MGKEKKIPSESKLENKVVPKKRKKRVTNENDYSFNDDSYSANNCRDIMSENYLGTASLF